MRTIEIDFDQLATVARLTDSVTTLPIEIARGEDIEINARFYTGDTLIEDWTDLVRVILRILPDSDRAAGAYCEDIVLEADFETAYAEDPGVGDPTEHCVFALSAAETAMLDLDDAQFARFYLSVWAEYSIDGNTKLEPLGQGIIHGVERGLAGAVQPVVRTITLDDLKMTDEFGNEVSLTITTDPNTGYKQIKVAP
jgi:hypothetical protein